MKMTGVGDTHYRTVALISPSPTFDVALIDDRFVLASNRYITTSLNTTGAIGGALTITPFDETWLGSFDTISIGTTNFVGPGLTELTNRGGVWPNHPDSALAIQTATHLRTSSNGVHAVYYNTANSPGERDLALRFSTSNNLSQIVVARLPSFTPSIIVTNATGFVVVHGREELKISTNNWEYSLGTQTNAAAVFQGTAGFTSTNNISISGGPTEVSIISLTNVNLSVSGPSGDRMIILPSSATNGNALLAKYGGVVWITADGSNSVTLRVQ
jgi:hypothetical protein